MLGSTIPISNLVTWWKLSHMMKKCLWKPTTILSELDEESETYFIDNYADFLNRLAHDKIVPASTIQEIAEEVLENCKRSQKIREKKLKHVL